MKKKIVAANWKMNLTHKEVIERLNLMNAILAVDADTTNVKATLVGRQANIRTRSSVPLAIQFPKSARVE